MATYDRERHAGEWEHAEGAGRQDYGHERPEYEWRRQQGAGGGRWGQERGPWGYRGGRAGREWQPASQEWRQEEYPWGQQGQEGHFGAPPRPYGRVPGRAGERPDSAWRREQQSRAWEHAEDEPAAPDYPWSPGRPLRTRLRPDFPWEHQASPREQPRYGRRGWEGGADGPHVGRGPKGYQRSDTRIREDICDRLTEHPAIDASEIEVEVRGCEVTLRGTVESRAVKHLAEAMAETVPGVRDIHNQLRVTRGQQRGQSQARQEG
jgi:hypothetical protein